MISKRILIFSLAYYPKVGGAEIAVRNITDRISDIEFDMVTLRFNSSDKAEERIGNVNVYRIKSSKNLFPFKAFFKAIKLHKEKPYDTIWAIMANWAGFAALFFKLRFPNIKYILTLQEGDPIEYINKKVRFIYPIFQKIFLKADIIQTISNFLADWAKDMGYKGKIEIIPNGVEFETFSEYSKTISSETEQFYSESEFQLTDDQASERFDSYFDDEISDFKDEKGIKESDVLLITISRLVKKNGIEDIIRALIFLKPNTKLLIFGEGPLEPELKKLVQKNKLESRVIFAGYFDYRDFLKYLESMPGIFVRPSLSEGMGNSFIEAMATGIPVVATPVGGIVDFLKDEETGLFCKVHDPKSIAEQVMKLINNPELKQKITTNAKRMVKEKYDWDLIARDMENKVFKTT